MELEIQYPVFVIHRNPDLLPFTIRKPADGLVAFAVLETEADALKEIAAAGINDAEAIRIDNPGELYAAIRTAAKLGKVNAICLLRHTCETGPKPAPEWHVFELATALDYVQEQRDRAKQAASN